MLKSKIKIIASIWVFPSCVVHNPHNWNPKTFTQSWSSSYSDPRSSPKIHFIMIFTRSYQYLVWALRLFEGTSIPNFVMQQILLNSSEAFGGEEILFSVLLDCQFPTTLHNMNLDMQLRNFTNINNEWNFSMIDLTLFKNSEVTNSW